MKTQVIMIAVCISLLFTACQYDNFEAPSSLLSGKVIYQGKPVSVRTNATQLKLWQDGFDLFTSITVNIAQDGTYSAALFDGQYKLTRLAGAPWQDQPEDTLLVEVRGNTVLDVPVTPFFVFRDATFSKGSGTITATFTIDQVVASAPIHSVNLYLGKGILTDSNKNESVTGLDDPSSAIGASATITATVPASLLQDDFIFARLGVRSSANEYYYTQVQKISLK